MLGKPSVWTDEMWRIRREEVLQRVRAGEIRCPGCGWSLSVMMAGGMYHREFARVACGPTDPCPFVDAVLVKKDGHAP